MLDKLQLILVEIELLLGEERLVELFKCPVRRKILDIKIRRRAEYENGAHDIEKDIAADLHKAHYNGRGAGKQKPASRARKASLSALAVRVVDIFEIRVKCIFAVCSNYKHIFLRFQSMPSACPRFFPSIPSFASSEMSREIILFISAFA